jgi:hypothetical protein
LPELVEGYLRDLLELTRGAGLGEVREYETTPEERTSDNSLGIYRLTLENIRERTPGELDELRRERAERLRALYAFLGVPAVTHQDGALEVSWGAGDDLGRCKMTGSSLRA